MTVKSEIVERLGERAVLLPSLLSAALVANDRIKGALSRLQDAVHGQGEGKAKALGGGQVLLPGLGALLSALADDLAAMLAPLDAAQAEESAALADRLAAILAALPGGEGERIDQRAVDALTMAHRGGADSLHLLVMDLHKAINRLSAATAVETLDGAKVHALGERDRAAVRAFMAGLNRTAPLAFGHPGLGTTAVHTGDRLTIQNDIGTTDAHVLVVHVDAGEVSVTYTDIHRPRAKFFISLFEGQGVTWTPLDEQRGDGLSEDIFYLVTGRLTTADAKAQDRFLSFLGSRIVFLIDWNKARKALQGFVGRNGAIGLLTWAARLDLGHRAFLEMGGDQLVVEAVQRTAAGRIPYGVRLDEALGEGPCTEFLQNVLRNTSEGLSAGRTARLIRDEIQAELSRRFETAESAVLTVLVRHLGLTRMLAGAISDSLSPAGPDGPAARARLAERAKRIEAKADLLTVTARDIAARLRQADLLRPIVDEVEDATDAFEDCAYLLSLLPAEMTPVAAEPLSRLAAIAVESAGWLVRAVEAASRLPEGQRADAIAALQAIDAVTNAERAADAAERAALAGLVATPSADARPLILGIEVARAIETATDHLSHAALSLRDRVLEELSA
ncbi:hypothetical protein [Zavarzinia aquatilis]|uniref:Phosphate transport regulator n=1 Tax=Zavarzinia aquatilis TaxID=2211142 RepID=A0A317EGR5_9PROT|nr:hypothetical protein [Zavarzinia aquatilis]PWR26049.1 hypothetical protein DKG74_02315 [Zavarzinia aquatilis]